jgi:hypothetical protein
MQDSVVVTVAGQTTAEDLLDLWNGSRLRYLGWLLILAGIFYAYLAFAKVVNEGFQQQTAFTIILDSLVVVLAFVGALFAPRARTQIMIRNGPTLREFRQYSLSDKGVQILSELLTCDYRWGAFYKISETRKSFLSFQSPLSALVIPKRFFVASEELAAVRKLVSANFKGKHRLLA